MEATLQSLSEQLQALNTRPIGPTHCFVCGKQGHIARNCKAQGAPTTATCFKCGNRPTTVHSRETAVGASSMECSPTQVSARTSQQCTTQHIPKACIHYREG